MPTEEWKPEGCKAPSRIYEWGTPMPCCGCPLRRITSPDVVYCDCRCHDSAKFFAGRKP